MYIRNNIMAMTVLRNLTHNYNMAAKSIFRLSTGYRINSAADDPAGLAISEKMRAQIRGLNVASRNCQNAVSLIQTAEGAMQSAHNILQRLRELSVQAASDANETTIDRDALNREYQELLKELNDIARTSRFNDMTLLDGSFQGKVIQSGPNQGDEFGISLEAINSTALGLDGTNLLSRQNASDAISATDSAIKRLASQRAGLGALHNRLEFKIANLDNMSENLQAAESRIRDVDIAKELTNLARYQILTQVGFAILAQVNAMPQMVLRLLFGR